MDVNKGDEWRVTFDEKGQRVTSSVFCRSLWPAFVMPGFPPSLQTVCLAVQLPGTLSPANFRHRSAVKTTVPPWRDQPALHSSGVVRMCNLAGLCGPYVDGLSVWK